jgi:hypothetical protein
LIQTNNIHQLRIGKYIVDPVLFEKGFTDGCGPFSCESTCCEGGVYADLNEKENILDHREMIFKYLDDTQQHNVNNWFEDTSEDDLDYPSGKSIGTMIYNDKCVFLNKEGMCSLQITGLREGIGPWAIKPFFCVAFPITVDEGVLTFDDYQQGSSHCCSVEDTKRATLIDACKVELEYMLGEQAYQQLKEIQRDKIGR